MTAAEEILDLLAGFTDDELAVLSPEQAAEFERAHDDAYAELGQWRPLPYQQIPGGAWAIWLFLAGRGTGKTDTGAFALNEHMLGPPCDSRLPGGHRGRIIGPTYTDAVAACVLGPSGVRAHNRAVQLKGTKEGTIVEWPNGAYARVFGAYGPEDPERLRSGGNSCIDLMDEFAVFRQIEGVWDQAAFGLRIGKTPRTIITTTPKNRPLVKALVAAAESFVKEPNPDRPRQERVIVTKATTADNPYLAQDVRDSLFAKYAGTRMGAQELEAELLDDLGTFFSRGWFGFRDQATDWQRKVRSWDLAGSPPGPANEDPDWSVGALVAYMPGETFTLVDGTTIQAGRFIVEDVVRLRDSPANVEQAVMDTARRDGPMVQVVIEREPGQSGKSQIAHFTQMLQGVALVREFSPSGPKPVRAQLVSAAAQQGRVEFVRGVWNDAVLDILEEFTGTTADRHDDDVDALSQAFAVLEGRGGPAEATAPTGSLPSRDQRLAGNRQFASVRDSIGRR